MKALSGGRVVIVRTKKHRNALGVVLSSSTASKERTFKVLVLCNQETSPEIAKSAETPPDTSRARVEPLRKEVLFEPEGPCGHTVVDLLGEDISVITTVTIKIMCDRIVDDYKKRQIPRFRYL